MIACRLIAQLFRPRQLLLRTACACALFMFLALIPKCFAAQGTEVNEYGVKASFLFNFARFVAWPPNSNSEMLFCVGADDFVAGQFERVLTGKYVDSRKIRVLRLRNAAAASQCSVIFLADSAPNELKSIPEQVSKLAILTVSESEDFPKRGGIINFFIEDDRVRFEISLENADRAGVKLSSKLLSLGTPVKSSLGWKR